MRSFFKSAWQILKQTAIDFVNYRITTLSAALAYYTIFSIAPMLLIIITLCDFFYGRAAIEGTIYHQLASIVGSNAALQIQELIKNATISNQFSWASVIGVITLIIAATSMFGTIQDSINMIWRLKAKPKKGWVKFLLNRLLSFSMLVTMGFILLVSLVINALMETLSTRLLHLLPGAAFSVAYVTNLVITFVAITFLFAIIFKVLPDAKIKWSDVMIGAITTAILFMLGKFAIGFYLGKSKVSTTYGAAGSLVIILLWVYYSAIILYFGAAFTRVYVECKGRQIYPNDYAVWVQQIEKESKASLQVQSGPIHIDVNDNKKEAT
jgi:membrane protein